MATINGDPNSVPTADALSGDNNPEGIATRDLIFGYLRNDELRGLGGFDTLYGGPGNDGLYGNEGNDVLYGEADDDVLRGGDGNDFMVGGAGDDLLFGQGGRNTVNGGPGMDRIIALGELNVDEQGNLLSEKPNGVDKLTGGPDADFFHLQKSQNAFGQLFTRGQKFARISDFSPGSDGDGDKIILPGSPDNYRAEFFGPNNGGTLIYYTQDPDIDISFGFGGVSFAPNFVVDIPLESALVAVLDNVVARNMYNSNFYEYTG